MCSKSNPFEFSSLIDLVTRVPDDKTASQIFAQVRWGDTPGCPHCGHERAYTIQDGMRFKCASCRKKFTVKVGTVFEDSKIGMRKWFIAIYLLVSHKKGVSSHQLARDAGVTQKTAWFMLHRLREALTKGSFDKPVNGTSEVDETYMGGKESNKHWDKKLKAGRGTTGKTPVMGIKNRDGEVFAKRVDDTKTETMADFVTENVAKGSILMTDEHAGYRNMSDHYDHRFVRHGRKEYVSGWDTSTNGIENYWSHLKRMVLGIHHHISDTHMDRYICSQSFRYNNRSISEWDKFNLTLDNSQGKRLTYKSLIGKAS